MNYRPLGKTGLFVSELSFGTIPILSGSVPVLPDYYSPDEEMAIAIMKKAFCLGCNLFDTAIVPEYGDSEIKLGKFVSQIQKKHIPRNSIIISDKARFFNGDEMYYAVCQSIKNLGTYPDIYFVHQVDAKNESLTFSKYGAIDALSELKAEGKIRFVGIASHYYSILLRGAKDSRVDVLQGSGNILERGMLERIQNEPLFQEKGFLLNKVYAAGTLPNFFSIQTLLSGVLTYPISSALIGLGTKQQVVQALANNLEHNSLLSFSQVICELEKSFTPIPCDRCQRCLCIYGTEIHTLFRQYNYYFLGKNYWALKKLDLGIRESAAQCKKCTDLSCIKQCPKSIRIPDMIQKIKQLVEIHIRNSWI